MITRAPGIIREIRKQAELTRIMREEPDIETWLNQDYEEQDIDIELRNLEKRKAHGNDGITGEEYKEKDKGSSTNNENNEHNKNRMPIPERWTEGEIVYIYKNNGGAGEYGNYRPICLTRIVYKIWSGLITRKLTKITHILTSKNPYVYKEGISTADEIIKVGQYIEQEDNKAKILLMGLSKAFLAP